MSDFWNERFSAAEYIYGTQPNDFFKQCIDALTPGTILVPGAGEGRDAVYAATLGWQVHAFDSSKAGREKALQLAAAHNVTIQYDLTDVRDFVAAPHSFDAIGITYFHLPTELRWPFHYQLGHILRPGGTLFMEMFTPAQLQHASGGPKDIDLLYTSTLLAADFKSMHILQNEEQEVTLSEGSYHQGIAHVVRFRAQL